MSSRVPDVDDTRALTLEATDLGWLGEGDDADWDQCVHGVATCTVGSIAITSRDCNLTAASLFLLRTLEHDHTASESVAPSNQLFPHCGHSPGSSPANGFRQTTWAVTAATSSGCATKPTRSTFHGASSTSRSASRRGSTRWRGSPITFARSTMPVRLGDVHAAVRPTPWRARDGTPSGSSGSSDERACDRRRRRVDRRSLRTSRHLQGRFDASGPGAFRHCDQGATHAVDRPALDGGACAPISARLRPERSVNRHRRAARSPRS